MQHDKHFAFIFHACISITEVISSPVDGGTIMLEKIPPARIEKFSLESSCRGPFLYDELWIQTMFYFAC